MHITCPLEKQIASALDAAGIRFLHESDAENKSKLDFYLPDLEVYIEVKAGHTDRIAAQTARARNVIVLQGEAFVHLFVVALRLSVPK